MLVHPALYCTVLCLLVIIARTNENLWTRLAAYSGLGLWIVFGAWYLFDFVTNR